MEEKSSDDSGTLPLMRRSQVLGVMLTVLLVGLSLCLLGLLLGLLLRKRERRSGTSGARGFGP